jgi:flavin-binding protein dodecin
MKGSTERPQQQKEARFYPVNTVFKSIELIAESTKSWEDAAAQCVTQASETLQNIRELKVESMKALIEEGKIARYRVRCRVAFAIDNELRSH